MPGSKQHKTATEQSTKLIALYARVSTARQEEEQTIQNQLLTLREFALKHNYRIVREYVDDGWSGDILARPALDGLRQDLKEKLWDGVLIYDPDRLARRYSYQELVSDELREEAQELRNKLLMFRFRRFGQVNQTPATLDPSAEPRLNQIIPRWLP